MLSSASPTEFEKNLPSSPNEELWSQVAQSLREKIGDATYNSWVSPLEFKEFMGGRYVITAPTRFMRDWVKNNLSVRILELLHNAAPSILTLDVIVQSDTSAPKKNKENQAKSSNVFSIVDSSSAEDAEWNDGDGMDFAGSFLDTRFTFENFIVGKPNELAYAAARRVADSTSVTFNPLFLYGGVGLGKTHLMHAIAWHIKNTHPKRRVIYLSAEKFMYQFIKALRFKNTVSFKEKFRSVDVLMIDDVQFISGKDSTQEEFFHTFNALVDQNHQVIVSADKSPSDLEGMEERLKSRLGWGLVADIHPTNYELRLGILQSKAEKMEIPIPRDIIEFLAHKITSNVRELEGALTRIMAHASLMGGQITLDMTQMILRDLLRANDRQLTSEDIQRKVAEHYHIRVSDMHSPKRARTVTRPRQVAMYLVKKLTTLSLPEIGRKFGGRDHTTVLHAVKKVEELLKEDRSTQEDINLLTRMLQS